MNNRLPLLTSAALLFSTMYGWGSQRIREQTPVAPPSNAFHFPYSDEQGWFLDESYLLWRPVLEDLDIATIYPFSFSFDASEFDLSLVVPQKIKKFNFNWDSGVRMGIGRFLPNHDNWDISAYMTYFYGSASGKAKQPTIISFDSVNDIFEISLMFGAYDGLLEYATTTSAKWRLNYFVWDLMLGRAFEITPRIYFHPYIGLRASLIDQEFIARNTLAFNFQDALVVVGKDRIKYDNDLWTVGPRIGANFNFEFARDWSLLGNLAAALMYGHQKIRGKNNAVLEVPTTNQRVAISLVNKDKTDDVFTNLEASVGLGWEHWYRNNTVRIAPAIFFEGVIWMNINNYFEPDTTFTQYHGSLGFTGLTFNFQVDF